MGGVRREMGDVRQPMMELNVRSGWRDGATAISSCGDEGANWQLTCTGARQATRSGGIGHFAINCEERLSASRAILPKAMSVDLGRRWPAFATTPAVHWRNSPHKRRSPRKWDCS